MEMGHRDRLQILTEILIRAKNERLPSKLARDANLNYDKFQELKNILLESGYMEFILTVDGLKLKATSQGIKFCEDVIENYEKVKNYYLAKLLKDYLKGI